MNTYLATGDVIDALQQAIQVFMERDQNPLPVESEVSLVGIITETKPRSAHE